MSSDLMHMPGLEIGSITITNTVLTTWGIMAALGVASWLATRDLKEENPGPLQTTLEGIVGSFHSAVSGVLPEDTARRVLPLISTFWIFLVISNLLGIIPGLDSPTRDLSATAPLAILVFFSVHWFGITASGLPAYLKHYLYPNPVLLPFHIVGEITRTVALAVRLFGNMMSLELTALLVLMVAGFLAPVPILMLHIVEALVQAYLFGMLALIYIASGVQTHKKAKQAKKE